jgi:hypothetical protein
VGEVVLAHPKKLRAICEAKVKTDKADARTLTELLSADLVPAARRRIAVTKGCEHALYDLQRRGPPAHRQGSRRGDDLHL